MRITEISDNINFYADANDPTVMYVEFVVPAIGARSTSRRLFVHIDSPKFKSYIRQYIMPNMNELSDSEILQEIKDILILGGNPEVVSPRVRTAGKLEEGRIEYGLNSFDDEYVVVTEKGWNVTKKHKSKFLKRNTLGTQVTPIQTGKNLLELVSPFVNADTDAKILLTAWLVQSFCLGNHNALLIMGEAGSGKSTLTKNIRRIIDPSKLQTNILPEKKEDLLATLTNSYFVAFDNTEELSKPVSDILCSAVTGATMTKRTFYTTNDLGVFELQNALILNGIDIVPVYSDLASRCLLLKLESIDDKNRQTDDTLATEFNQVLPDILGAIFDTLSVAMKVLPTLKPERLPRMASAYIEMLAIAVAMGVSEAEFSRIYFSNLKQIDTERANTAIVEAVQEYMFSSNIKGRSVEGRVGDVYKEICNNYSGRKSDLPKFSSHFSRRLKREKNAFDSVGLTINLDDTFADGTHIKIIKNK